jgi:outer membrane protein TolC
LSDVDAGTISATTPFGAMEVSLGDPILNSMAVKLAVQQPLFSGDRIRSSIDQSSALLAASRSDRERAEQTAEAQIENAYWAAVLAKEAAASFAENVKQAELHLADARNLRKQGLLTVNDELKAEMRLSSAKLKRIEADATLTVARTRLNLLIGLPWDESTDTAPIDAELEAAAAAPPLPPLAELIARSLEKRPESAAARERIAAAKSAVNMARSPLYPGVSLIGDVTVANPNSRIFPAREQFDTTWSVGVQVALDAGKIPSTLAQTAQAKARLGSALDSLKPTLDQVTQEVVSSYLDLTKTIEQIENAKTYLAQAEESLRTTRELFTRGVALDSDVADAEAALLSARLENARARVGRLSAEAALRLALGERREASAESAAQPPASEAREAAK